ncbi:hypothetical protein B0J15DRAFT_576966 [Fusarium solani]|uniref:Uncharacterized protein n=1 Tax=Fusarium solani TaxID=169388 RepID=A0A9P9RAW1_FUSSL|nr:uncharacterized protein B0J15DRAFT_576966 [Fusarium solani]KAH7271778.1 hypothetical protein B0J15DRAFT_576966 [Fusarium solani]
MDWSRKAAEVYLSGAYGPSPPKGLDSGISSPFTRLQNGTFLHNRSERDVYRILIDSFRFRMEEQCQHDGQAVEGTIYDDLDDSLPAFKQYLETAASRRNLLPPWWTPQKQRECEAFGMTGTDFQDLHMALEQFSATWHYADSRFPSQLRMLAEAVYETGVGGTIVTMGKFRTLITSLGKRWFQRGKKNTDEDDGDTPADNTPDNESPSADDSTPLGDEEGELAPLTRQGHRISVEEWFSDSEPSRSSLRLNESPSQSSQGLPIVYEDPAEEEPSRDRVEPSPPPRRRPRRQVRFSYPPAEAGPSRRPPDYTPPPPQWNEHIQTGFGQSSTQAEQSSQPHPAQRLLQPRQMQFLSLNAISHEICITQMFKNPLLWTNKQLQAINCTILSELASRQLPNNASWERNTMSSSRFRNPWRDVAASPLTSATRVIEQLNQGTTYACWFLIPALLRGFGLWPAAFR